MTNHVKVCVHDGCDGEAGLPGTARSLCLSHYGDFLRARNVPCTVAGCEASSSDPGQSKGLCAKHKYRMDTYGTTDDFGMSRIPNGLTLGERLERKVDKSSGCWVWLDKAFALMWAGKSSSARLLSWEASVGTTPHEDQWLRSTCKTKRCVNPEHMELGLKFHLRERQPKLTALDRFDRNYRINPLTQCWEWTASKHATGYSQFTDGTGKATTGHRFAFATFKGPLRRGLVLDHLCEVRHCVNPNHLEQVTQSVNVKRSAFRPPEARVPGIIYAQDAPVIQ